MRVRTIFFGTPEFAVPILKAAIQIKEIELKVVVTGSDQLIGRKKILTPPPVKKTALKLGLRVLQPKNLKDFSEIKKILDFKPELGILCAYGKIIPSSLLQSIPKGIINVHPSLLPKFRGPTPIISALLSGEKETGVCLMLLDEEIDHGPLIICEKKDIAPDDNFVTLSKKLAKSSAALLKKYLPLYLNRKIKAVPQDHHKATFTKKLTREDARINWNERAEKIECQIRAFYGYSPAWTDDLLILKARVSKEKSIQTPGTVLNIKGEMAVATGSNLLIIDEIQPAGKKKMSGTAYLLGHKSLINSVLS